MFVYFIFASSAALYTTLDYWLLMALYFNTDAKLFIPNIEQSNIYKSAHRHIDMAGVNISVNIFFLYRNVDSSVKWADEWNDA